MTGDDTTGKAGPEVEFGADPAVGQGPQVIEDLMRQQAEAMQALFTPFLPTAQSSLPEPAQMQDWAMSAAKLQKMWLDFTAEQAGKMRPICR